MVGTIQSEFRCLSSNACFKFSPIGQNSFVQQVFDEIHFSNRHGRTFFEEPSASLFDGRSFGLVKDVGTGWVEKMFEYFSPTEVESDGKAEKRRKKRRRKKWRKTSPSLSTTELVHSDWSTNFTDPSDDWHRQWANLNNYDNPRTFFSDQPSHSMTTTLSDDDVIDDVDVDGDLSRQRLMTVIKYVPIVPKELLPIWRQMLKNGNFDFGAKNFDDEDGEMLTAESRDNYSRKKFRKHRKRLRGSPGFRRRKNRNRAKNRRRKNRISKPDLDASGSDLNYSPEFEAVEDKTTSTRKRGCGNSGSFKINSVTLLPLYLINFLILVFLFVMAVGTK